MQEQYDQAIEWERRSIAAGPDLVFPLIDLAAALAQDRRDAEARDILASYRARGGPMRSIAQMSSYYSDGLQQFRMAGVYGQGH
jgi:hypothetical protein